MARVEAVVGAFPIADAVQRRPLLALPTEGQVIGGKYRVEGILGSGGRATVLLARHLGLDERVDIELLEPVGDVRVLLRASKASATICSNHVVRVLDVGTLPNDQPFVVMEHLNGETLADRLSRGALPVAEAIDHLLEACGGVAAAHALGIVHGDLGPSSWFLERRPNAAVRVKVLNFGFARCEQLDQRADLAGLGATLYEMLAGARPSDGTPPPPLPDLPASLQRALSRALQQDPERGFASVLELSRAMAPYGSRRAQLALAELESRTSLSFLPGRPTPSQESVGWQALLILALLLVVVLLALGIPWLAYPRAP